MLRFATIAQEAGDRAPMVGTARSVERPPVLLSRRDAAHLVAPARTRRRRHRVAHHSAGLEQIAISISTLLDWSVQYSSELSKYSTVYCTVLNAGAAGGAHDERLGGERRCERQRRRARRRAAAEAPAPAPARAVAAALAPPARGRRKRWERQRRAAQEASSRTPAPEPESGVGCGARAAGGQREIRTGLVCLWCRCWWNNWRWRWRRRRAFARSRRFVAISESGLI